VRGISSESAENKAQRRNGALWQRQRETVEMAAQVVAGSSLKGGGCGAGKAEETVLQRICRSVYERNSKGAANAARYTERRYLAIRRYGRYETR